MRRREACKPAAACDTKPRCCVMQMCTPYGEVVGTWGLARPFLHHKPWFQAGGAKTISDPKWLWNMTHLRTVIGLFQPHANSQEGVSARMHQSYANYWFRTTTLTQHPGRKPSSSFRSRNHQLIVPLSIEEWRWDRFVAPTLFCNHQIR